MYRPKKRQLVRRATAASAVALVAVAGIGITLISQSGAVTSALKAQKAAVATTSSTTKSAASTATLTIPKYHIISTRHDDSHRSGDD